MWSDMTAVLQAFLSTAQGLWSLYTGVWFLSGALVLLIVRKVLRTFNLI